MPPQCSSTQTDKFYRKVLIESLAEQQVEWQYLEILDSFTLMVRHQLLQNGLLLGP